MAAAPAKLAVMVVVMLLILQHLISVELVALVEFVSMIQPKF